MLLRALFKACATAREPQKKAAHAECAPRLVPTLTALLAVLEGPNLSEARFGVFFGGLGLTPIFSSPPASPAPPSTP
jgi:hypothetical protein